MFAPAMAVQTTALPAEISDKDFWRMIVDLSEPGGTYPYENFVSNELEYQDVIPALKATTKPGGVYIGVGPEQNFTYAAVLQSKLAFVIDIRRQNMLELLMYKALFDMSPSRADFVSNLFSRTRPAGLDTKTTSAALFAAYESAKVDSELLAKNLQAIKAYIEENLHKARLSAEMAGRSLGISPRYIRRLFAEEGQGFSDYVMQRRLERIHRQLASPLFAARPIADLAFEAGLVEPSTFYRQFRSRYRMTPSEVRAGLAQ